MEENQKKKNLKNNILPQGEIVIYRTPDKQINLKVKLERESVWLSQARIASLFRTDRSVITRHINNIFQSGELMEKSNVQKMHIPFSEINLFHFGTYCSGWQKGND